ncbi:unnamed protein product [Oppiella nova]|uniref:AB hydrolase-1 domain-containing protein n=1 Tax=Oppiella nova TaxID=334625 RepID=A0A7R9QRR1_9ACAR|nr:unnamed protein product [Oppiella nova]CAG2172562.1 unnamed protein product [Oppiella nova]
MPKEFIEMKIPVPYGRIMAKAWGNSDSHCHKVLAIHGWQDNAGSFDTLVPLLPESLYILAVDLPGHGLSSHLPPGCPYTDIMFLIEVKRIVDYMEWNEFTILGHSMGGMIGLLYSSLYPQSVTKVILLDTIKSFCYPWDKWPQKVADITKVFVQMDQKNSIPPVYDHKTMIERMKGSTAIYKDINEEAIECLLSRGSKVSSDGKGEYFSRDIRTKLIFARPPFTKILMKRRLSVF